MQAIAPADREPFLHRSGVPRRRGMLTFFSEHPPMQLRRFRAPLLALLCATGLPACKDGQDANLQAPASLEPTGGTAVNDTAPYSPARETRP
jgi:hypothetical protein